MPLRQPKDLAISGDSVRIRKSEGERKTNFLLLMIISLDARANYPVPGSS